MTGLHPFYFIPKIYASSHCLTQGENARYTGRYSDSPRLWRGITVAGPSLTFNRIPLLISDAAIKENQYS